jgi:hypothetical protein
MCIINTKNMSKILLVENQKDNSANQFENHVKLSTGNQLNIEWTAHKLFDEKGDLTGIITIGENITEL